MKAKTFIKAWPVALAGLLLCAAAVQAQVAAPRLGDVGSVTDPSTINNTGYITVGPSNPAVLPWHASSMLGASVMTDITREDDPGGGGTVQEVASGDGMGVLLRFVGDPVSAEIEYANADLDVPAAPGTAEGTATRLSLAMLAGAQLTIGVGLESSETTLDFGGGANTIEHSMPVVGATLRIGDTFYLGGAYGARTNTVANGAVEADGGVGRLGVGFHSRKGEQGFHAELFHESQELIEARDATGVLVLATEYAATGATLEVLFSNIVIGAEVLSTELDAIDPSTGPGLVTSDIAQRRISIGWVPEQGLTLSLAVMEWEETRTGSPNTETSDTVMVSAGWAF